MSESAGITQLKPREDIVQTLFILWLLGAVIIVTLGVIRDREPLDWHKGATLLALALSWPLLVVVFSLGVLLCLIGMALHVYRRR